VEKMVIAERIGYVGTFFIPVRPIPACWYVAASEYRRNLFHGNRRRKAISFPSNIPPVDGNLSATLLHLQIYEVKSEQ
jgi:hypothetical protein